MFAPGVKALFMLEPPDLFRHGLAQIWRFSFGSNSEECKAYAKFVKRLYEKNVLFGCVYIELHRFAEK